MRHLIPLLIVTACADPSLPEQHEEKRELTVQEKDVAKANTAFGLALLKQVHTSEPSGNVLLSPLSVSMALGMTLNGAHGDTWEAMRRTLAFDASSQQQINLAYDGLIRQLRARDPKVEFGLANSIWYHTGFPVLPTFTDTVRRYFDAEVRSIDFRSSASPGIISEWAEQKTNGRIKELIKQINQDEIMFLVNAVYFKAPWTQVFDEQATHAAPFRRSDGSTVNARMMSGDGVYNFVDKDGVKAVELLYGDTAFSMVLVSTDKEYPFDAVKWDALIASMQRGRIMLRMPKFKFTYEKVLNNTLTALGMGIAFSEMSADFRRITPPPPRLVISRVQHKTFIDVHEKGTEAAGATAVGVGVVSMPPELSFDRPFIFAIRERSTGTLLFVGRVNDPTLQ